MSCKQTSRRATSCIAFGRSCSQQMKSAAAGLAMLVTAATALDRPYQVEFEVAMSKDTFERFVVEAPPHRLPSSRLPPDPSRVRQLHG